MSMNFLPVYSQLTFEDGYPRQSINIQQRDNESMVNSQLFLMPITCFNFPISKAISFDSFFFFCGEYRSRTDDLLLAKQAL